MTTRTVSTELTPAQRQAFEEAVERYGKSFFANADLIWKTLLGAAGDGWQPIAASDRVEGISVLLGWAQSEGMPPVMGFWSGDYHGVHAWCDEHYEQDFDPQPTHWMPLPAAPKGDA